MRKGLIGLLLVILLFAGETLGTPQEFRGPRLGQSDEAQLELAIAFLSRGISAGDVRRIVGSTTAQRPSECDSLEMAVEDLLGSLRSDGLRLISGFAVEDLTIEGDSAVVVCSAQPILVRRSDRTIIECGRTTETIVFVRQLDVWKMANEEWLLRWLRRIRDGWEPKQ